MVAPDGTALEATGIRIDFAGNGSTKSAANRSICPVSAASSDARCARRAAAKRAVFDIGAAAADADAAAVGTK
jgi:hypothetical protein